MSEVMDSIYTKSTKARREWRPKNQGELTNSDWQEKNGFIVIQQMHCKSCILFLKFKPKEKLFLYCYHSAENRQKGDVKQ